MFTELSLAVTMASFYSRREELKCLREPSRHVSETGRDQVSWEALVLSRKKPGRECKPSVARFSARNAGSWGTWVAQSVRHPTLGFGSGHDLRVM